MELLFLNLGTPEFMLVLLSLLMPLGLTVLIFYVVYRIVDRWVDKSLTVRREQNVLLSKLIEKLEEPKAP